ncbi:unnamed protein product [Rotaria sp. Silwood1]|nr:unnamed protein product [Rotaria sp. Silwood1]CAF1326237.1 unnamed protein product [Rotaria sp. Silwood1]CAF3609993.1 unnamed protein product [Rotaria sp. Silwood1]CAF4591306.1 unnamed protein product [Rotaria sp. Silwood1]
MDSDQESSECPLCLEVLEADDLTFFPCTCCYQICRFCWHRIRTDENGLCPACRKPYSENPAQFKPLTEEEIQQVKRDRKLKESNKKPKITESRKHLANLRVVQRNLVFVNGLPSRLADTELLRRNDHFGKYGKIVKLVTSPAHNGQLNSICVYITYSRSDEALRAIQSLCNYHVDGRTLKATLGTTKYCSRYLKGATCQKADCLYLHELGDPLASFTKEQMQQGLHLEYERKLMEQYTNKTISDTPKTGRTTVNGNKSESSQKRKGPTPLLTTTNDSNTTIQTSNILNGHSDLESGDETNNNNNITTTSNHHTLNGYHNDTFTSTTAMNGDTLNGDSDISSTSSQTSSEHDPSLRTQIPTYNISPSTNWPDESVNFYPKNNINNNNNLVSSSQLINKSSVTNILNPSKDIQTNETTMNNTVKVFDQLPEYKLFSSNSPSIHSILFGKNENTQQLQRPLINGIDHDLRDIEKRLIESSLDNTSYSQTQENDELGFDPCSLFMSALASDIEDERRPLSSQTSLSYRPTSNSYGFSSNQFISTTNNPTIGQINSSWMMQQQQQQHQPPQQQQYHHYSEQPTTPQRQQRYPLPFNGSSPRQIWNGNQQPYGSQISNRLDFSNQIQQQRLPHTQPSPSSQYSQAINNTYSSNSTVTTNNLPSNDRWINLPWTDPAIISLGNKLDTTPSQWSTTMQSQGSSPLSSGNNLMANSRWSQQQQQQQSQHMLTNGMYMPYSTTSGVDDGSRSLS